MSDFDLSAENVRRLNASLHSDEVTGKTIDVGNPGGKHNVAAGPALPCIVILAAWFIPAQ